MARLRLFAAMRDVTGTTHVDLNGTTVGEVLQEASDRFGPEFDRLLPFCNVMVGEDKADISTAVAESDEVSILPPVSGG